MKNYAPVTLDQYINESKSITLKRGYGAKQPVVVGASAPIRNQVLAYVAEGKRVKSADLKRFVAGLNETNANPAAAATMWLRRNGKFFVTEGRQGVTYFKLSPLGQRLVNRFAAPVGLSEAKKYDFKDPKTKEPGIVDKDKEEIEECGVKESHDLGGRLSSKLHNLLSKDRDKDEKELDGFEYEITKKGNNLGVLTEERRKRIEQIIENIKSRQRKSLNEEEEEEKEDKEEGSADELSFDDLDLDGEEKEEGEKEEAEGEEKEEGDGDLDLDLGGEGEEKEEGEEDKVEITEFILTVDDVDAAIKELEEKGVTAEKVVDPDAEPEEGDEEAYKKDEISVKAEDWDELKGWLEEKDVDVKEMFGGEIEVEEVEDEEEGDEGKEGEKEEGDGDLDLDLEGEGEGDELELAEGEGEGDELELDEGDEGDELELDDRERHSIYGEDEDAELDLDDGEDEDVEDEELDVGESLTGMENHENDTNNLIKGAKQVIINYK